MVLVGLVVVWAAAYAVLATVIACRTPAATSHRVVPPTHVLLVRPVTGAAPGIVAAMATVPRVPDGVQLRWIAAVADLHDPAWPLARRAATAMQAAGIDAEVVLTGATGPNRKAEQLGVVCTRHGADVVVVVDADVDLASVDLGALLGPLADDERTGVTWAPPVEVRGSTMGDRISAAILGGSWHAFDLLARIDPRLLVGKCFAVRRDVLTDVGGFAALRMYLGEDFELARRVDAAGLAIRCTAHAVHSWASGRSVAEVIERYSRWLWVVRAQRPLRLLAYPVWLCGAPLLVLAGAATMLVHPPIGAAIVTVVLATRAAIAAMARRAAGVRGSGIDVADALLADVALGWALLRVLVRREVRWADRALRLGRDGRLEPVAAASHDPARERG